jgi:hypothetical protein
MRKTLEAPFDGVNSMSSKPLHRRAAFAALALVAFASPQALAQAYQQLHFNLPERIGSIAWDASSDAGRTRYSFHVPEEAFDLRVAMTNASLAGNASLVVRHGDGTVVCTGRQVAGEVICERYEQLKAGMHYIDLVTGAGQEERVDVAFVPVLEFVAEMPEGRPFQFANLVAFHDSFNAPTCLESRHAQVVEGAPLAEAACLPMGNQQQWKFEALGGGDFAIRNLHNASCLATESESTEIGARVVESRCDGRASQVWRILGAGGYTYHTKLANMHAGRCLDFRDGTAKLVHCGDDAPHAPLWFLRDDDDRGKHVQPKSGGMFPVVRGGLCMSDDGRWVALGDCANAATSRYEVGPSYFAGTGDPGDGQFMIGSVDNPYWQQCVTVTDWGDGYRYASMTECDAADSRQRWTLAADANDWQFRNVGTGECLNAQYGTAHAGTRLITWPCAPGSDNARWRYVGK